MATVQPLRDGIHRQCASGILSRYAAHFLFWGILLGIGILLTSLGVSRPKSGTLLPGALFVVGSFACCVPIYIGLGRHPRSARVMADGVQWQDGQGEHFWRWEEIVAVYRLDKLINQSFRVQELRLVQASGEVTFDQTLSDYARLADAVQDAVARQQLPAKRSQVSGAGAEFGAITLHKDGITIGHRKFAWPEIEQVTIRRGILVVFARGYDGQQCEMAALSAVPNYTLLLTLLQELRPSKPLNS